MVSALRCVLIVVGGVSSGVVLGEPSVDTYIDFGSSSVFDSDVAAAAAGSIVAMLAATVCRGRSQVATTVLAGALLVAIVALPGAWSYDIYPATIGAGLILGGLSAMCWGPQLLCRQSVLSGAVVAGLLTASPIAEYRSFAASSSGWAAYVEVSEQPANVVWLSSAVAVAVFTIATLVIGGVDTGDARAWDMRELVAGVGIPFIAIVLYWSFDRALYTPTSDFGQGRWVLGVLIVPIVIIAALSLRNRSGKLLLAATALLVSARAAEELTPGAWPILLIPSILVALGVWLGRRYPVPLVGIGVLALVTATAIFERAPWDNMHFVATIFALPCAAAYTIVASLPSTATVTATSLTLPAVMALPLMIQFGWTAYTPLTEANQDFPEDVPSTWTVMTVAASVASVIACGAAMAWLQYRRPSRDNAA